MNIITAIKPAPARPEKKLNEDAVVRNLDLLRDQQRIAWLVYRLTHTTPSVVEAAPDWDETEE